MAFQPPRPSALRPRVVGCSVPRDLYDQLARIATARQISVSQVMREGLVKAFSAPRGDAQDEPEP